MFTQMMLNLLTKELRVSEFILWDRIFKRFTSEFPNNYCLDLDGKVKEFGNSYIKKEKDTAFDVLSYIGKTDVNGDRIYADCSIVETTILDESGAIILFGFFMYNKKELRYELNIELNGKEPVCLHFDSERMVNVKVVDTIQENKLGIIKEKHNG